MAVVTMAPLEFYFKKEKEKIVIYKNLSLLAFSSKNERRKIKICFFLVTIEKRDLE